MKTASIAVHYSAAISAGNLLFSFYRSSSAVLFLVEHLFRLNVFQIPNLFKYLLYYVPAYKGPYLCL